MPFLSPIASPCGLHRRGHSGLDERHGRCDIPHVSITDSRARTIFLVTLLPQGVASGRFPRLMGFRDDLGKTELGKLLREARERTGLEQRAVATELGFNATRMSEWERGVHAPDGVSLARLLLFYRSRSDDVSIDEMLGASPARLRPGHVVIDEKLKRKVLAATSKRQARKLANLSPEVVLLALPISDDMEVVDPEEAERILQSVHDHMEQIDEELVKDLARRLVRPRGKGEGDGDRRTSKA